MGVIHNDIVDRLEFGILGALRETFINAEWCLAVEFSLNGDMSLAMRGVGVFPGWNRLPDSITADFHGCLATHPHRVEFVGFDLLLAGGQLFLKLLLFLGTLFLVFLAALSARCEVILYIILLSQASLKILFTFLVRLFAFIFFVILLGLLRRNPPLEDGTCNIITDIVGAVQVTNASVIKPVTSLAALGGLAEKSTLVRAFRLGIATTNQRL